MLFCPLLLQRDQPQGVPSTGGSNSPFPSWILWMLFNAVPSKGERLQVPQPAGDGL